jgi:acetylornithine/N-succinyldiaminopimelate aminotransferase
VARATEMGNALIRGIRELAARHRSIGEIRGIGLMIGIEVGSAAPDIVKRLLRKGIIANAANNTVLRLLPPFIISKKDIEVFLVALDEILKEVESA